MDWQDEEEIDSPTQPSLPRGVAFVTSHVDDPMEIDSIGTSDEAIAAAEANEDDADEAEVAAQVFDSGAAAEDSVATQAEDNGSEANESEDSEEKANGADDAVATLTKPDEAATTMQRAIRCHNAHCTLMRLRNEAEVERCSWITVTS